MDKYCTCCATDEELEKGTGKRVLVVLAVQRTRKGGAFWACPDCDGDLAELSLRKWKLD